MSLSFLLRVIICVLSGFFLLVPFQTGQAAHAYIGAQGRLLTITAETGSRRLVSGWTMPAAAYLTIHPATGAVYTADQNDCAVYHVNPPDGVARMISGPGVGAGPALTDRVFGIAIGLDGSLSVADGEQGLMAVVKIDPETGHRTIISAGANTPFPRGTGLGFRSPLGIAVEKTGHFLVTDMRRNAVIRVDPRTGDRTVVSGDPLGDNIGSGPSMESDSGSPTGIAVRADGMIFVNGGSGNLLQIDPITGHRAFAGNVQVDLGGLVFGPNGSLFSCAGFFSKEFLFPRATFTERNLVSGQDTILSGVTIDSLLYEMGIGSGWDMSKYVRGSGPLFGQAIGVALESSGQFLIGDVGLRTILRVDPVTGDRHPLPASRRGSGEDLSIVKGITVDATGAIWVMDNLRLQRVDPLTGDRVVVSAGSNTSGQRGNGSNFDRPNGAALEPSGTVVVADASLMSPKILRIDPATGHRSVASGEAKGSGPLLIEPYGIVVDQAGFLVVTDIRLKGVVRIHPLTGDRVLLSGNSRGDGPPFSYVQGLAQLPDGSFVVAEMGSRGIIYHVDPVTGNRVPLSGPLRGSGPALTALCDVAVVNSTTLLALSSEGQLWEIDLDTGNRKVISDSSTGSGPYLVGTPSFLAVKADPVDNGKARLSGGQRLKDHSFQFQLHGLSNQLYVIERSTNLVQWNVLTNVIGDGTARTVLDPSASTRARAFYRAVTKP